MECCLVEALLQLLGLRVHFGPDLRHLALKALEVGQKGLPVVWQDVRMGSCFQFGFASVGRVCQRLVFVQKGWVV